MAKIVFHREAWQDLAKEVVESDGVDRMQRVADAANAHLKKGPGYKVSVEGDNPLDKRDFRATVITTTPEAMNDNRKHNRLVAELHRAEGE
jgi:hypothetical protein